MGGRANTGLFSPVLIPEFMVSTDSLFTTFSFPSLEGHRGLAFLPLSLPPPTLLPGCPPPKPAAKPALLIWIEIDISVLLSYPAQLWKNTQPPPRVCIGFSLVTTGKDAKVNKNSNEKVQGISERMTSVCSCSSQTCMKYIFLVTFFPKSFLMCLYESFLVLLLEACTTLTTLLIF